MPITSTNLTLDGHADLDGAGNAIANVILGNVGKNELSGGDGDDTLNGGKGDDTMIGDAGNDTFVYVTGDGADKINGFTAGGSDDRINLLGVAAVTSFAQLMSTFVTTVDADGDTFADDTLITFSAELDRLDRCRQDYSDH